MGLPPLTNNTAKTSADKDLVKIRQASTDKKRKEKRKHRKRTKT